MVRRERVLERNGLLRLAARTQWDMVSHGCPQEDLGLSGIDLAVSCCVRGAGEVEAWTITVAAASRRHEEIVIMAGRPLENLYQFSLLGEAPRLGRTVQYTSGNKHPQVIDVVEFAKLLE
jgi:hypothetical protein